ncbi:MAG: DUF3857 domain-containing protein [Chitinophagales bacterium]
MKKITYLITLYITIFIVQYSNASTTYAAGDAPIYAARNIPPELVKGAKAVIRNSVESFTVKTEGTATYKNYCAITILNENGRDFGYISEQYDQFTNMSKITATLYDANGKAVRKLKKEEVSDMSATTFSSGYGDNRVVTAKMVYDDYPYTIEYEYTINYKGLLFYPAWYPQSEEGLAVQKSNFIIEVPNSLPLRYYSESDELKPKIAKEAASTIYTWKTENLKAIEIEPYGPAWSGQVLRVLTAPTDFKIDGYSGSMDSWESFGEWYFALNKGRDELSSETILKVRQLTENAKTNKEKVKLVYQYLQDHTRYVSIQLGIGGWQTFEAKDVEKNNYGDCKALTNYMQAMLKVIDIPSKPVLVKAGRKASKVCAGFCSNQFNHIFLTVPLSEEQDTLWLECTSQQSPLNYMGDFTDDRNVLLIDEQGSRIIRTPASTAKDNKRERSIEARILEDGGIAAKVDIRYRGLQQDYPRAVATLASPREQEEWLQEVIELSGVTINEYEFTTVSKDEPLVELQVDIHARQYASKAGKRLLINPNLLSRITTVPKKMEERTQPLVLQRPYSYEDEVHYTIPEGFAIESMPSEPVKIESEFGTYQAQFFMSEDGKLQYSRKFQQNKVDLPAEKYEDFRQFMMEVNKADKTQVVLVKGE